MYFLRVIEEKMVAVNELSTEKVRYEDLQRRYEALQSKYETLSKQHLDTPSSMKQMQRRYILPICTQEIVLV